MATQRDAQTKLQEKRFRAARLEDERKRKEPPSRTALVKSRVVERLVAALSCRLCSTSGLNTPRIILDERFLTTVPIRGVEVELQHLVVNLVEAPVVVVEPVNRAHYARAVTATGAVHVELAGCGVV